MVIQVKLAKTSKIKVRTRIVVPDNISIINDVDTTNVQDGYVLMYDEELQKYVFVDPDVVLSKSVVDNLLPSDFINKLDIDLDDRIDLDAGGF
jgi:hypothetical protein